MCCDASQQAAAAAAAAAAVTMTTIRLRTVLDRGRKPSFTRLSAAENAIIKCVWSPAVPVCDTGAVCV